MKYKVNFSFQLIKQAQEYQKQCEILTKQEAEMKSQVLLVLMAFWI